MVSEMARRPQMPPPEQVEPAYGVGMTIGQVAELWRFPCKSLGGVKVDQAEIGPRGLRGDRLWAVRDLEREITASARRMPALLTATARYTGPVPPDAGPGNVPEIEVTFPDGTVLSSSDAEIHARLSDLAGRDVRLTALPPAEDTSLHRMRLHSQKDAVSSASVRADFGVDEERSRRTSPCCRWPTSSSWAAIQPRPECSSTWRRSMS